MKNHTKRNLGIILVTAFLIGIGFSAGVAYSDSSAIRVLIDGKDINCDPAPFIQGGRVFVPLRAISEALGKPVKWDAKSNSVQIGTNPEGVDLVNELSPYDGKESHLLTDSISVCGIPYSYGYCIDGPWGAHWNLGGNYIRLTFSLAMKDGDPSDADVSVYGDGKLLTRVTNKTNTAPKDVSVDISGVKILQLVNDDGGAGYVLNPRVQ